MAFTVPDFGLVCNIFSGVAFPLGAPRLSPPCNLAVGKRVYSGTTEFGGSLFGYPLTPAMVLLLPAGTDVRGFVQTAAPDIVEVPAGSGRWYQATGVDDVGKGYPNEFRFAHLAQVSQHVDARYNGLFWPVPIP